MPDCASQEQITTFLLGEFPTVRAAEKLRDCLCRYNPDKLFLANYQQITNPEISINKMKLTNDQIHKIITAVCTCITTIAAIILTSACTLSLSVQKQNNNSNQGTEQTTSVDSLSINPVLKK